MQRIISTTLAICISLSFVGMSLAGNEDGVRASYDGTPDLPDGIAFRAFLRVIDSSDPEAFDLVATALNMPLNNHTRRRVQERTEFFKNAHRYLLDEKKSTTFRMLCPDDIGSRTKEHTYEVLNKLDDVQEIIAEKHYIVTISALSAAERHAFQDFLNEMKTGISYVKVDNRVGLDSGQQDVRFRAEQRCYELALSINGSQGR